MRTLVVSVAVTWLAGCGTQPHDLAAGNRYTSPPVQVQNSVPVKEASMDKEPPRPLANVFTASEREERHQGPSWFETSPFSVSYTRTGEYRGFRYAILFDRDRQLVNGSIDRADSDQDRWVVLTDVDAMTDERSWRIVNHKTSLSILMDAPGKPAIACLGRADFPGRRFSVRVGGNQAITFPPGTCSASKVKLLFEQLMKGVRLLHVVMNGHTTFPRT